MLPDQHTNHQSKVCFFKNSIQKSARKQLYKICIKKQLYKIYQDGAGQKYPQTMYIYLGDSSIVEQRDPRKLKPIQIVE